MEEDKLTKILQDKLGGLAKPILHNLEKNFKLSPAMRDELALKINLAGSKAETIFSIQKGAAEISRNSSSPRVEEDKLNKYLQPILGKACTDETIKRLEQLHPELKDNDNLKDKFIKEIDKFPEEDRNYMVVAILKISKIKEILTANGDESEFSDSYKDLENITTRLLKNFYSVAKFGKESLTDETLSDDEKINIMTGPVASATCIVFNDRIEESANSPEQAVKELDLVYSSAAGGIKDFPLIVQYMAERSAQAADAVFDKKEYRKFSKWLKDKTIQDAKHTALTGKPSTDMNINTPSIIKQGKQYG